MTESKRAEIAEDFLEKNEFTGTGHGMIFMLIHAKGEDVCVLGKMNSFFGNTTAVLGTESDHPGMPRRFLGNSVTLLGTKTPFSGNSVVLPGDHGTFPR